jgi:uncharacterized protein YjbI with pentapeptide repeats
LSGSSDPRLLRETVSPKAAGGAAAWGQDDQPHQPDPDNYPRNVPILTSIQHYPATMVQIHSDEPALIDSLGRAAYVRALSQVLRSCETPLVVGLYGSWGSGKTSLLKQLQESLIVDSRYRTIWYDPWLHQFDEHPAVGLLQSTYNQLSLDKTSKRGEHIKSIVIGISYALAKTAVTHVPIVGNDLSVLVDQAGKINDSIRSQELEQSFQKRELQQHLRESFMEFVAVALEPSSRGMEFPERLFFFIDDLDRCTPDRVVSLLESLKLFLNVPKCVFILGLDREPVEAAIGQQYAWAKSSQSEYLDKIIQLELAIPSVALAAREVFVRDLLVKVFGEASATAAPLTLTRDVVRLLSVGVGGNPRQLKRTVGSFSLMHILGTELVPDYRAERLALALLIQQKSPELLRILSIQPERVNELTIDGGAEPEDGEDFGELYYKYVANDYEFANAVKLAASSIDSDLLPYLQLAEPGRELGPEYYLPEILELHARYVNGYSDGQQAILDGTSLTGLSIQNRNLTYASFVAVTLNNANISRVDLSEADLSGSSVKGAHFTYAHFARTKAATLLAKGSIFQDCDFVDADFSGTDFTEATFSNVRIKNCRFTGACFDRSTFSDSTIEGVDWFSVKSTLEADFSSSQLIACNFSGARIEASTFRSIKHCGLVRSDFSGCDLSGSELEGADLSDSNFTRARMMNVNLSGTIVRGSDLRWAVLERARLDDADLSETILDEAKMIDIFALNANFCGASLRRADLRGADLRNADFSGAIMSGAIFDIEALDMVRWDDYTVWPDDGMQK